jgi:hypothetical protein
VTRALAGALIALGTYLVSDIRGMVGKQSDSIAELKAEVSAYKTAATTEDIKLGGRIDVLELRLQLATAELDKRLAEWDRYWRDFQPAIQRWIARQAHRAPDE